MAPIFVTFGSLKLYSFGIFILLAWAVYSFIFWRHLRNNGVDDDKIFDLTFVQTIVVFVVSRLVYVVVHPAFFTDTLLKIAAVWITPGFSFYGLVVGLVLISIFMSRRLKIRLGYVMDGLGLALCGAFILGAVGSLLDGSVYGIPSGMPWAVRYIGQTGLRHPIQIYSAIAFIVTYFILLYIQKQSLVKKWPYGIIGVWFFLLFGLLQCVIEFFRDTTVKIGGISLTQWVLIGILSESVGVLYIKTGGKQKILSLLKELYDTFPKRSARKDPHNA